MPKINAGMKRSLAVWGILLTFAALYAGFHKVPSKPVLIALIVLLMAELALIVDKFTGNTLSEAAWWLNRRPLFPHICGVAMGWAIGLGWIDPFSALIGYLGGHFFWQAYSAPRCSRCGACDDDPETPTPAPSGGPVIDTPGGTQ